MSESSATSLVFAAGGLMIALALLSGQGDTYKRVWAAGLWTTLLALLADVAPELTGWFALAVIVGAVATNEGVFGKFFAGAAPSQPVQPSQPAAPARP